MTFSSHMTDVRGMHRSLSSSGTGEASGKMSVICLSESAEVLMRGLEYSFTRAAAEMVHRSQALTLSTNYSFHPLHTPSVSHFFSPSLSHSLTHTSLFLGLSPQCLSTLFFLWVSLSLTVQSSVFVLLNIPSISNSASLCYNQTPLILLCIHPPPLLVCWP